MSKGYQPECQDCWWVGSIKPLTEEGLAKAMVELADHVCWKKCGMCGRYVPALVDDGPLCIRCDLVVYPEERAA